MASENLNELREMRTELGMLSRSDGSALLTQGATTVLASVTGPVEVKLQNLNVEKATIEVYYRPKSGLSSVDDRFIENFIQQSVEFALLSGLHPRTAYKIQLQEMENCGGLLACLVNATCLALLNSGLELRFMVAAVHCIINDEGKIIIDPTIKTIQENINSFTFVFDSLNKNTVAVQTTGKFTEKQYQEAMDGCRSTSEKIFDFYKEVLQKFSVVL